MPGFSLQKLYMENMAFFLLHISQGHRAYRTRASDLRGIKTRIPWCKGIPDTFLVVARAVETRRLIGTVPDGQGSQFELVNDPVLFFVFPVAILIMYGNI